MLRIRPVDLMLSGAIVLWALNITLSKYILTEAMKPLAYSGLRYSCAALVFLGITTWRERSLRLGGRDAALIAGAAILLLYVNQISFVYALDLTSASTVGLIFGITPIVTALIAFAFGMERPTRRFAVATVVSFAGVALVAAGSGGSLSSDLGGNLLAVVMASTWGAYSVAISVLMRRWSPGRISAVVLSTAGAMIMLTGLPQLLSQDFGAVSGWIWLLFALAVLGPLVLTNYLWFIALDRVGPSYATLFGNLQPFVAVLFAVVLLSERLSLVEVAGGFAIAVGVGLAWRRSAAPVPAE